MAEVASAYVTLIPSAKGFASKIGSQVGPDLDAAGKSGGKRFAKGMGGAVSAGLKGVVAGIGVALAGGAAIGFLKDSIAEARESQKVGAITEQVIKSTGGAAKVTAGQVGDLATAISNKTGIDDEAIQSASNLLLTFKNLRNETGKGNDVFNQATQIATDMGAALGTEPKAAAIQLGKALNDPIKGIAALSRVGVTFDAQQQKQIKTLVKSGNTLDAQKIILKELNSEFGGTAAASATAGEKLSTTFGNFKEQIGTALLPVIDKIATKLTKDVIPAVSGFLTQMTNGTGAGGEFVDKIKAGAKVLADFAKFVSRNSDVLIPLVAVLASAAAVIKIVSLATKAYAAVQAILNAVMSANPISLVIIAIAALVAGIIIAYKKSETFRTIVQAVGKAVVTVFKAIATFWLTVVSGILTGLSMLLGALGHLPGKMGAPFRAAKEAVDKARGAVDRLSDSINGIPKPKPITFSLPGSSAAIQKLADLRWQLEHMPRSVTIGVNNKLANIPGRATGGPVTAGQAYIVGEHRPELFVPSTSGRIIPQVPSQAARAGAIDYDRLAQAMSRVNLSVPVSSIDRALVGRLG